jgi:hypothetical protein
MTDPDDLITDRWLLYRRARESGTGEVEAYDRFLHPRTRIPDEELVSDADSEATR